jgi:hypothetical protein
MAISYVKAITCIPAFDIRRLLSKRHALDCMVSSSTMDARICSHTTEARTLWAFSSRKWWPLPGDLRGGQRHAHNQRGGAAFRGA